MEKKKASRDRRGASKPCCIIKLVSPSADCGLRTDSHLLKEAKEKHTGALKGTDAAILFKARLTKQQ